MTNHPRLLLPILSGTDHSKCHCLCSDPFPASQRISKASADPDNNCDIEQQKCSCQLLSVILMATGLNDLIQSCSLSGVLLQLWGFPAQSSFQTDS